MGQQVPNGFRQPKFKYRMKIVSSRRHFAANWLKIRDFGHRKPGLPECVFLKIGLCRVIRIGEGVIDHRDNPHRSTAFAT